MTAGTTKLGQRLQSVAPPLIWGGLFLLGWESLVNWRNIKPFLLPTPSAIGKELWKDKERLFSADQNSLFLNAAKSTGFNALTGLVLGTVFAVSLQWWLNDFRSYET